MQEDKRKLSPLTETLICAVIFLACVFTGKYILLPLLLLPLLGAYICARNGVYWALLLLITGGVIFWFLIPEYFIIATVMAAIPSLASGIAIRKKLTAYETLIISAGGWLLAVGAAVAYTYITMGISPLEAVSTVLRTAFESDDNACILAYQTVRISDLTGLNTNDFLQGLNELMNVSSATARAYVLEDKIFAGISNSLGVALCELSMFAVIFGGVAGCVVPRVLAKKGGMEVSFMPQFTMFRLPRKASAYFVISFFLSMLPSLFDIENLLLAGVMLQSALIAIFAIQGVSLVCWLFSLKIHNHKVAVAVGVLVGVSLISFVYWLGLFEQVLRIRDRYFERKNGKEQ